MDLPGDSVRTPAGFWQRRQGGVALEMPNVVAEFQKPTPFESGGAPVLALFIILACVVTFILAVMFLRSPAEPGTVPKPKGAVNNLPIFSPLEGTVVPISEPLYARLANGGLGQGLAIRPRGGKVCAPFDGTVIAAYPTGHAVELRHAGGVKVLIHIEVDTPMLHGGHFDLKVHCGQHIKAGQLVVEFDRAGIATDVRNTVVSVIVLNGKRYPQIAQITSGSVLHGEALFMAIAAENCADT